MRIWSIHPKYLDAKGIVAVWRETLLAQKVLLGKTKGYKNHPQLIRFRNTKNPISAIGAYLHQIYLEALRRNYQFDSEKILKRNTNQIIKVTKGQVEFEWAHFKLKTKKRDKNNFKKIENEKYPEIHPLFRVIKGEKEYWEKS